MSAHAATPTPIWRKRSTRGDWLTFAAWVLGLAFVTWAFQVMTKDTIWSFVTDAPRQAQDIGARMIPPDWSFVRELWWPLWETLNMATLGTIAGVLLAVPIAFLAARNTTPSARFVRPLALLAIVSSRSINSLIWALLLVAILGPGVLAGISVFRWDINIRESTVLGLVGAGGIGVKLQAALGTLAWPKVTMLLIAIFATVIVSEWVTAKVRQKLI